MFRTSLNKKRVVGLLLFAVILSLFLSFNRFPKLDTVEEDLAAVSAPQERCFQGFCIDTEPGTTLVSRWLEFSSTYLRLVALGMTFAFLVAGLTEAFLFPRSGGSGFTSSKGIFKRTLQGLAIGPVMNLCSACIVPVSAAFQRRGVGIEGAIAMVQGSSTLNVPSLVMATVVFSPLLGISRIVMALLGALLIGPLVVMIVAKGRPDSSREQSAPKTQDPEETSEWKPVLVQAFREWARSSLGYLVRMGPVMVVAGFAGGLAIQWLSPATVETYLGNHALGIAIAATIGLLINVPLLFEIPLVALLLLLGMGTAPAATLLFAAAAGGPVTFWGLAKVMPRRAITTFATATWAVGMIGGLSVLGIGSMLTDDAGLTIRSVEASKLSSDSPIFTDETSSAGVDFVHQEFSSEKIDIGAGVAILDFDDDGFQDVFVSNSAGPNALYRNNQGDGTFSNVAVHAGVDDPHGRGNGACAGDYDNDGSQDIYVTNYGPSRLFHNNGDGTFADATAAAGLDEAGGTYRSTGCAWGDYDQDGFLDLIVVRHLHEWYPEILLTKEFLPAVRSLALFHNRGDGTFTNITSMLADTSGPDPGLHGGDFGNLWGAGYQPGWVDFDNDGDLDLYVVNDFGAEIQPNVLWRNDGPGPGETWRFVDASAGSGAAIPMFGMGLAVGDYNLDGFLDLFVTNIKDNVLLRNNGDGLTFTDTLADAGAEIGMIGNRLRVAWAAMFLDYDNDGDEDLYIVSGYIKGGPPPANPKEQPNVLLRNERGNAFTDVSLISGADDPGFGRGGAYLDYDNDGCLDLFVANLGQQARLLRNTCDHGNNWLVIKTVGTASNRDGIGSRITVVSNGTSQIREIAGGASHMGQNMMAAHFGLGRNKAAESVSIRWPSGHVQTITNVAANQQLVVTETQ